MAKAVATGTVAQCRQRGKVGEASCCGFGGLAERCMRSAQGAEREGTMCLCSSLALVLSPRSSVVNRRAARRDPKSVHAACRTRAPATSIQAPTPAAWQPSSHVCAIVSAVFKSLACTPHEGHTGTACSRCVCPTRRKAMAATRDADRCLACTSCVRQVHQDRQVQDGTAAQATARYLSECRL